MSNTTIRLISGVVMLIAVVGCIYGGVFPTLIAIGVIGPLIVDEIITNFYAQKRTSIRYLLAQAIFIGGYWFFNFYQISRSSFSFWISMGIVLNIGLLSYLFLVYRKSETLLKIFRATSWGAGLFALIPLMCLSYIIHLPKWELLLFGLILLNFMVDTAAYFTGKKFGRHKLWEAVSPKKTIEGAIGGVTCSVVLTSLFWNHFIDDVTVFTVIFFTITACCSQVGDLAQSKLKRQFEIKDSSSLIPGHGGVYDRVDSLLFVSPMYAFYLMANFQ
ncbi:MAG TPA: phosphatidate cytidylyltransferase [Bacteriovoracaceae bacterium]|nr:phosphatidate cytidylyltransferase [Bacteriovoracaceae bacterium]